MTEQIENTRSRKLPSDATGSPTKYVTGFMLSVVLTVITYLLVTHHSFSRETIIVAIMGLAFLQFIVQLFFFLHLGSDTRPRWKLYVLLFMLLIVGIIVIGSLWIMNHLNYHMDMEHVHEYLNAQDNL